MKDAVFVIPAHGRHRLADACLRGMRWTCDRLYDDGFQVTCVVVNDEPEIKESARKCEFHYLTRPNYTLGKKWNDGIEYAMISLESDLVIPCGSDDIYHPDLAAMHLEARNGPDCVPYLVGSNRTTSIVSPNGMNLAELDITYDGGDGARALPRETLELVGYRPADDNLRRAMDTSMKREIERISGKPIQYEYRDINPRQIVDFKSYEGQLNSYIECAKIFGTRIVSDPFKELSDMWPPEVLDPIRSLYEI